MSHIENKNYKHDKQFIMMVGNIGSGKTTYIKQKSGEFIVVSRDKIRYMLGDDTYIFIKELEPAVARGSLYIFESLLETNINIILDETNICQRMRRPYINMAKEQNYKITAAVLPKLPKEVCVQRRMSNPHGEYSKETWENVWEQFNKIYEEPTIQEGFDDILYI